MASGEVESEGLAFYQTGFITTKLRADDYDRFIQKGWTRCGSYLYLRSVQKCCCEVYAYKVDVDNFVLSKS